MKLKIVLSMFLVSLFTFSTAYADKPVGISKADGPYSLEIGTSIYAGKHKIMRNQNNKNTILIFDDFLNFDNWEQTEYKALNEFCSNNNLTYKVLAISYMTKQVAGKLIGI